MPESVAPKAKSLQRVLGANCCSGCGLCASISESGIEMTMTADGFLRPRQIAPVSTQVDRLIADVCPGMKLTQTSREGDDHPLWGPIVSLRIGASTDQALRHHASSGGVLSALLQYLLKSGVVDYVVQTAASDQAPLENVTVDSRSHDEVFRAAGSRYSPSAPLENLDHFLEQPGRFALVAKPCDIAAARALARHDPRVDEKIPLMLSFFCAGIPSLGGAQAILDRLGVKPNDVNAFRYRGDGWPGRATASLKNGEERSVSYAVSWGEILSKRVQFRCKICPDGSGGFADIACADAWHCDENGYPLFEEDDGRSLIVSRTGRGEDYVSSAILAGAIAAEPFQINEIANMQPSQARRKRLVLSRLLAMRLLGRKVPRYQGLHIGLAARAASAGSHLRSFVGMMKRLGIWRRSHN